MRVFLAIGLFAASLSAADCPLSYCELWKGECATGMKQSPIASNAASRKRDTTLRKVVVHYAADKIAVTMENTSATLKSQPISKKALVITYGGADYALDEFHFHTPAEHVIDVWNSARRPVAEIHLVHKRAGATPVVLGLPIYLGTAPNAAIEALKAHGRPDACKSVVVDGVPMGALVPREIARYITYVGSLTTPPCSEPIRFVLLNEGITVTQAELDFLRITMNARPAQYNPNPVTYRP